MNIPQNFSIWYKQKPDSKTGKSCLNARVEETHVEAQGAYIEKYEEHSQQKQDGADFCCKQNNTLSKKLKLSTIYFNIEQQQNYVIR